MVHPVEAYLSNCSPIGVDYCILFNTTLLIIHLLAFFTSNIVVRYYADQAEGLNFSFSQLFQCSVIKTVTIGISIVGGFISLVITTYLISLDSYNNILVYMGYTLYLAGLFLHVLKEHQFTFSLMRAELVKIQSILLCRNNVVNPAQEQQDQYAPFPNPRCINVLPISALDDGGIFTG